MKRKIIVKTVEIASKNPLMRKLDFKGKFNSEISEEANHLSKDLL